MHLPLFLWGCLGLAVKQSQSALDHVIGGEAEFLHDDVAGSGCAEVIYADDVSIETDIAEPAGCGSGFDCQAGGDGRRQNLVPVFLRLSFEKLEAGHADDSHANALLGQFVSRGQAVLYLRTGSHEDTLFNKRVADEVDSLSRFSRPFEDFAVQTSHRAACNNADWQDETDMICSILRIRVLWPAGKSWETLTIRYEVLERFQAFDRSDDRKRGLL